nr:MAG TPA: hypothetical protein [Bacteriophage sp.]
MAKHAQRKSTPLARRAAEYRLISPVYHLKPLKSSGPCRRIPGGFFALQAKFGAAQEPGRRCVE